MSYLGRFIANPDESVRKRNVVHNAWKVTRVGTKTVRVNAFLPCLAHGSTGRQVAPPDPHPAVLGRWLDLADESYAHTKNIWACVVGGVQHNLASGTLAEPTNCTHQHRHHRHASNLPIHRPIANE